MNKEGIMFILVLRVCACFSKQRMHELRRDNQNVCMSVRAAWQITDTRIKEIIMFIRVLTECACQLTDN